MSQTVQTVSGEADVSVPRKGAQIIRAFRPGVEIRSAADGGKTMVGHFAVFNTFTEINSYMEGHFLERIAPGAFKKTFRERTPKVLFQHGMDPQVGDKPLGSVEALSEDETGAAYEVSLLDTSYVRDILPGLEAGLYGASFRFRVTREETVENPKASPENPNGLPERTIKEAQVMEFGPVTFPAYAEATAGVRSLTDRFLFDAIERDPERAREVLPDELRAAGDSLRMDTEDLSTLAQILVLGAQYIEEQDEPGDEKNIPVMEGALEVIAGLVPVEVAEDEPAEDEDDAGRSENAGRTLKEKTPPLVGTRADGPRRPLYGTSDSERREPIYGLNGKEIPSWRL